MKDFIWAIQLGVSIGGCFLVGSIGGYVLDTIFGSSPIFIIVGVLLATVSSFMILIKGGKKR